MTRRFVLLALALTACSSAAAPNAQSTPSTTPIAVVAAPSAPVVDPCAGVPPLPVDLGFACVAAGRGSYRVEVEDIAEAPCEACFEEGVPAHVGSFHLAYVSETGAHAVGASVPFRVEVGATVHVEAKSVFDFDGDGTSELAVSIATSFPEESYETTQVVTPVGAALVPYSPAEAFADAIDEARDVDADGRPDFVSFAPWFEGRFAASEGGGGFWGGPKALFHALPDGTFTREDDVALAFVRECGRVTRMVPPVTRDMEDPWSLYEDANDAALRNVTCVALLEGVDVARSRFDAEWAHHPCTFDRDECDALEVLLRRRLEEMAGP